MSVVLLLTSTLLMASAPMPVEYCLPEADGPPKAMGVMSAYGLILGERYRDDAMTQDELMAAMTRIQGVIRKFAENDPEAACALIEPFETDYALDRPDMQAVPLAPQ